ncbi:MAG: DUF4922 domain-containing protein [Proteobacteria bacterium]|nr:DUF4922 domain-containing protein [Pseudomonadota bacterium]
MNPWPLEPSTPVFKIYAAFAGDNNSTNLSGLCLELLSEQKKTWLQLREGYESLKNVRIREIPCDGFSVRVQHNPGRIRSTMADVEGKAINGRPCFLCLNNLPEGQKGIFYRNLYLILCNPAPVFPSHLTISRLNHHPQAIAEHIDTLLRLAGDFGDRWTILYNGPKCGASAPDHLHFQVIPSGQMPIEKECLEEKNLTVITGVDGVYILRARDLGREIIIIEGDDPAYIASVFKEILAAMKKVLHTDEEPMVSIAGFYKKERWRLLVFPRAKHRPDAFFKKDNYRVVVSPAVIEMGGVIVTPVESDFERLDASDVEGIYREVSLKAGIVDSILAVVA